MDGSPGSVRVVAKLAPARLIVGFLGFVVPFGAGLAFAEAFGVRSLPLWFWPSTAVLCGALGTLGAVAFSYDIAREVTINDRGLSLRTANRQVSYDWDEIEPRAWVFPGQIRVKARDGTIFFLTLDVVTRMNSLPFGPTWNVEGLPRW